VKAVDPREVPDWDGMVAGIEGCTPFHSEAWARVLVDSYGYEPMYLLNGDGEGRAVLPLMEVRSVLTGRRGVSLPFTDEASALGRSPAAVGRLGEAAIERGRERGWRSVRLRGGEPFGPGTRPSMSYRTHRLDLRLEEAQLFENLSSATRRATRRAERAGLDVSIEHDADAMRVFCRLNDLTRRTHGLPPQPARFFEAVQRRVLATDLGFVVLARHEGRPIAAAVFLCFGRTAVFKYGASNRRYQSTRANDLVMWRGILACKRAGCHTLRLGRTRRQNEGLLRFKRGWGGVESALHYYTYDLRHDRFTTDRDHADGIHNTLFRHLPLPLSYLAGKALYRHMA
jgi:hypothetical protein